MEAINITELRKNTKSIISKVVDDCKEIIIHRQNQGDAVIISLDKFNSMEETLFLLSSEKNRDRLNLGVEQVNNSKTTKIKINEL